jgi:hypothetical protein
VTTIAASACDATLGLLLGTLLVLGIIAQPTSLIQLLVQVQQVLIIHKHLVL